MKQIILIITLAITHFSYAQEKKIHYFNGNLKRIENYKNKKKDGVWKYYYKNKHKTDSVKLKMVEYYKDGQLKERKDYDNGALYTIEHYNNGSENGEYKKYHNNGTLETIGYYKDGSNIGEWKHYYTNGTLESIEH